MHISTISTTDKATSEAKEDEIIILKPNSLRVSTLLVEKDDSTSKTFYLLLRIMKKKIMKSLPKTTATVLASVASGLPTALPTPFSPNIVTDI